MPCWVKLVESAASTVSRDRIAGCVVILHKPARLPSRRGKFLPHQPVPSPRANRIKAQRPELLCHLDVVVKSKRQFARPPHTRCFFIQFASTSMFGNG